jgi:hypothetical protein
MSPICYGEREICPSRAGAGPVVDVMSVTALSRRPHYRRTAVDTLTCTLFAGILGVGSVFLLSGAGLSRASDRDRTPLARVTIDSPLADSVFPPEITPPTILWRDASATAKRRVVEVSFSGHSSEIRLEVPDELMQPGELDPASGSS